MGLPILGIFGLSDYPDILATIVQGVMVNMIYLSFVSVFEIHQETMKVLCGTLSVSLNPAISIIASRVFVPHGTPFVLRNSFEVFFGNKRNLVFGENNFGVGLFRDHHRRFFTAFGSALPTRDGPILA